MKEILILAPQIRPAPLNSSLPNARLKQIQSKKYPIGMARYSKIEATPTVLNYMDFAIVPC